MAMGSEILRKEVLPFAAMIVVVCMEMATSTIAKAALNSGLSPLIYVVYYNFLGVLFLLPGFVIQRHSFRRHPLPLSLYMLSRCLILGLLGTCVVVLGNQGLNYGSPTLSAAISNLTPGFTFVLAMVFRMEKFEVKRRSWQAKSLGTILSIIGASLMSLYEGPTILGSSSSTSPSDLSQQSLLSQYSSRLVVGSIMIVATFLFVSGSNILQKATLKDYPEQITVVFFSNCFASIQCAIVSLLLERKLDSWKLQPGIGMAAIVAAAVLEPVGSKSIIALCLDMKGPVYVAMFKPLGVVIAAALSLLFLSDALHLGSILGSIIIIVGFYVVMWGMWREATILNEATDFLCESGAVNGTSSPLLHK